MNRVLRVNPLSGQERKRSHPHANETRSTFAQGFLLDRACDGGERIIGVAADQTNRADNEYQDYSQHHGVFRDVLTCFVSPQFQGEVEHYTPFLAGVFSVLEGGRVKRLEY